MGRSQNYRKFDRLRSNRIPNKIYKRCFAFKPGKDMLGTRIMMTSKINGFGYIIEDTQLFGEIRARNTYRETLFKTNLDCIAIKLQSRQAVGPGCFRRITVVKFCWRPRGRNCDAGAAAPPTRG